jgi:hypothetical protein
MDEDLQYLAPDFDPSSLTVPRLRSILVQHNVNYPASAKKPQLIELFNESVLPQAQKLLRAQARVKRSSRGITDVPSSQASAADEEEENIRQMRPPPIPDTPRRASRRRTTQAQVDGSTDEEPTKVSSAGRTPGRPSKRASSKNVRTSEGDSGVELPKENLAPPKRTRKSISPAVKREERQSDDGESPFTQDNPFQSGSSPPGPDEDLPRGERRRRTLGLAETEQVRRTSKPFKRAEPPAHKRQSNAVVRSSNTYEMPVARIKREEVEEPSAGEEFTPDEQQDLAVARANNENRDVLPARRRRQAGSTSSSVAKVGTGSVLFAALVGFATLWRQEQLEVGYCGVGRPPSTDIKGVEIPEWASIVQPQCIPCPPHAFCSDMLKTTCETDFVLQPHPLSFGGLVPLAPSCEPDGEKAKKVQRVAERAVEELRERNAKFECGDLVDEKTGKQVNNPELGEGQLKAEVSSMRRKGMNEEEFEELWRSALPEILGREEVTSGTDG